MELFYTLLFLTLIQTVSCQVCGEGWQEYGDKCYQARTNSGTWSKARMNCQKESGDLVLVPSKDVNDFLESWLLGNTNDHWIGLHDVSAEGNFIWINGKTPTFYGFENWLTGEPDNINDEEDCVYLNAKTGLWADGDCGVSRKSICERPLSVVSELCNVYGGLRSFNNKCYEFRNQNWYWNNAETYCVGTGGHIVSIDSQEEADFIADYMVTYPYTIHIGFTDQFSGTAGVFEWSDGTVATSYIDWAPNEPDLSNYDPSGNCGRINLADSPQWSTKQCTGSNARYICETPQGTCPLGWRLFQGQCYQFNVNNPKTWTDARHYCEAEGAYLTTIRTDAENQYLVSQFEELYGLGVTDVYIGISDERVDGTFEWTQVISESYVNWNDGMPRNYVGQIDCGSMYTNDYRGRWDSVNCFLLQPFICKVEVGATLTDVPPDTSLGRCEAGWELFGDSCYYFSTSSTKSWQTSSDLCTGMGADLASVHSPEEQSFLTTRMDVYRASTWIGMNDLVAEGVYTWSDGTNVDFTNWGTGAPFGAGDCARLKTDRSQLGEWTDSGSCDDVYRYVCKKDKIDDGTVNTPSVPPSIGHDLHCGYNWEYNPDSGLCYSFRFGDYQSWSDARYQCRIEGGDLTSVSGFDEENFLLDRVKDSSEGAAWFGANDLSNEGGWEWSDGSGFRYIAWNTGQPDNYGDQGEQCGEFLFSTGKWNDNDCSKTLSYICKRSEYLSTNFFAYTLAKLDGNDNQIISDMWPWECAMRCVSINTFTCRSFDYDRVNRVCYLSATNKDLAGIGLTPTQDTLYPFDYYERDMSITTAAPPTPVPETFGCEAGWKHYNGYCFMSNLFFDDFANSQSVCQTMGGHLASVRDKNENGFLVSFLKEAYPIYDQFWIGLTDQTTEMYYEWTDNTDVAFTAWSYYEPNNVGEEDCGELYVPEGRWNDMACTGVFFPGVCKKPAMDLGNVPIEEGCAAGEKAYMSSCYMVQSGIRASWSDAQDRCASNGGHLVIINDMYEQMFFGALLGLEIDMTEFWIGLSQGDDGVYAWVDGSTDVTATNWAEGYPDNSKGTCVGSNTGSSASGYWFNTNCGTYQGFVCERLRYGFTTQPPKPPVQTTYPSNFGCANGWIGFGDNCFEINEVWGNGEGALATGLSWDDARADCLAKGGDLASYHGPGEEKYITDTYIPQDPTVSQAYWIGLNDLAVEGGYTWTDGSPLDYTNWGDGEPNDYGGTEECAESFVNQDRGWNDNACNNLLSWICKIPKGKAPITPSPPPPPGSPCPTDPTWVYREPYCYYRSDPTGDGRLSFDEAEDYCHEGGGHLASIHDTGEQDFINSLLREQLVKEYWIGLKDANFGSGIFEWSDGSPYDYSNWMPGQPDFYNGEEQCVDNHQDQNDGNWGDQNCGIRQTYVCKKDSGNTEPVTHEPTTPAYGGCPNSSWLKLDNRCYHMEGGNDLSKWVDWQTARTRCAALAPGAILGTIQDRLAQSELTAYLYYTQADVWIGLSDIGQEGKYHWVDGSTLDFTNWLPGQPDGQIVLPDGSRSDCAVMTNDPDHPGRWNDIACDKSHAFLCEVTPNPAYPDIPIGNEVCIKSSYYKYGQDCYKVNPTLMTFNDAKRYCENEGTVLATIVDGYQEAFVETQVAKYGGERLWIGLFDDTSDGRFKWLDGWPVYYTDWANNEPSLRNGEQCVVIKSNGRWDNVPCSELHYPICKDSTAIPPTTVMPGPGTCDKDWLPFGSHCYKFDITSTYASRVEAEYDCEQNGAQLASIHSKQENEFIRASAFTSVGLRSIWIDMIRGFDDEFEHTDGTPVDYVNWANDEPSGSVAGQAQDCVEMYPDSYGKWNDEDCGATAGYVCKKPKSVPQVPTSPKPTTVMCPTDAEWYYNYPYCYYVSPAIGNGIKSWKNANSWCNTKGGYLASVHSTSEHNYMMSIVQTLVPSYWIGLEEDSGTNEFKWTDGTDVDYLKWGSGQPDDYQGQEACVEVHPLDVGGTWNDLACGVEQAFMCKRRWDNTTPILPTPTPAPVDGGCPSGWYRLDMKCYQLHGTAGSGKMAWQAAQDDCKRYPGGDLASIHYQGVMSLLTTLMKDHVFNGAWIGLTDKGTFRKFHWSDGTDLDYENWGAGQPDGQIYRPNEDDCVELTNDPDHPGKWDDVACDLDRMYICQRPVDPSLPADTPPFLNLCSTPGYRSYFDSCYKVDTTPRTYDAARGACETDGAYLASIHDGYEEAFIETEMLKNGFSAAWIGLKQDSNTQVFGWIDSWPVLFTNWGNREPSNLPGEGCVTVTGEATWDNINCGVKQISVCKYTSAPRPTTVAPGEGTCPPGWVAYADSCYLFDLVTDRAKWVEGQAYCENEGATLASIHSKGENNFIRAKATELVDFRTGNVWIGLTHDDANDLAWIDGSPLDYTNWANGEPDGKTGSDCVEMFYDEYGKWDDKDCSIGSGYVCKKPKQPLADMTTQKRVTLPPVGGTTVNGVTGQPAKQTSGTSAGLVVGILLAVIFIIVAVVLIGFFMYQRHTKEKLALADVNLGVTSFANVLYESKSEAIGVEMVTKPTTEPGTQA